MAPLVQERVKVLSEVPAYVDFFDAVPFLPDDFAKATKDEWAAGLLDDVAEAFEQVDWKADDLKAVVVAVAEGRGLKVAKAQAPVRVAVTGRTVGPPLFESLELLGRAATLERIRAARARL